MREHDPCERHSRRRVLVGVGAAVSTGLAGCGSTAGDGTPEEPDFDRLDVTSVRIHEALAMSVPDAVSTVDDPVNAAVLVRPGDAAVDVERVADWLAAGKILALVGPAAQSTWIEWARSDAVDEHFDTSRVSEADPAPQLLVTGAVGLSLPTFRTTWDDDQTDRDVWTAIDDALVDVQDRRTSDQ